MLRPKVALTIAGSDPSCGAGIAADLKVFTAYGVYGTAVITALTSQNTLGVREIYPVEPQFVRCQLEVLLEDIKPDAVKVGMLWSAEVVEAVAEAVDKYRLAPLVLDPVIAASDGTRLADEAAVMFMKARLFSRTALLTPNVPECERLTGLEIADLAAVKEAAAALLAVPGAPAAVLVKGGHLPGEAVDLLYDGRRFFEFHSRRRPGSCHGTGCVLSAAVAARLALGDDLVSAVGAAKEFITRRLEEACVSLGAGASLIHYPAV